MKADFVNIKKYTLKPREMTQNKKNQRGIIKSTNEIIVIKKTLNPKEDRKKGRKETTYEINWKKLQNGIFILNYIDDYIKCKWSHFPIKRDFQVR